VRVSQGALLAATAALAYGSLGVFAKLAYAEGWNVPSLLAVRFLLASLTILPFALAARGATWQGFGGAFLVGAIGYTSTTALYFPSIRFLPAAVARTPMPSAHRAPARVVGTSRRPVASETRR
jgi:drug/metabolite transporter (DMT)-like permease